MGDKTGIEWTATVNPDGTMTPGATWNPTVGCDRKSPGCDACYAKKLHDKRHKAVLAGKTGLAPQYAQPFETIQLMPDRLDTPLHWRRPRRIFVDSVSDLFYGDEQDRLQAERDGREFTPVPFEFTDRVFAVMALASQHTFQILTKRAERMRDYLVSRSDPSSRHVRMQAILQNADSPHSTPEFAWPLPNVWLGPSIENQTQADRRFPIACELGEAGWNVMVSMEPLLGPVTIPDRFLALGRRAWVIVGGENGPRPFDLAWARAVLAQCKSADVPLFMKQLGSHAIDGHLSTKELVEGGAGRPRPADQPLTDAEATDILHDLTVRMEKFGRRLPLRDRKGGDLTEFPPDLRVREFPAVRA